MAAGQGLSHFKHPFLTKAVVDQVHLELLRLKKPAPANPLLGSRRYLD